MAEQFRRNRNRRRALTGVALAVLALAGCDDSSDAISAPSKATRPGTPPAGPGSPSASATPSSTPSSTAGTPQAPLTGTAVSAAARDRAAVVVVLGTTTGPQETRGLSAADVVYEEFSGGGSRQVAVFHSRDPASVGPVGPTFPLDRKVATVFGGLLAYSGGTARFVRMLDKAPMATVNALASPTGFIRRGTSTRQTYAVVRTLRSSAARTRPKAVLSFSTSAGPSASVAPTKATRATVRLSTGRSQEWTHFPDRLWRRTVGGKAVRTADGGSVAVANLVFQMTPYQNVFVKSSTATVGTPDVLGTGSATVCAAAGCIAGTWQRRGYSASSNFFDGKRSAVRVSRGSTWVLLAPTGSTLALR